ncbi:MAG: choice-of-anchor E domain-containing protein [Pseudomonadota bacterium]
MMKRLALLAAAMATSATASTAATLSFSDSVAVQSTDWSETASVSKFDPSLGTLTSVRFTLFGEVEGDATAESLDASPSQVTLDVEARITAAGAGLPAALGTVVPVASVVQNFTAFDGVIDFDGGSGASLLGLTGDETVVNVFNDAATLAFFTGLGTADIDLTGEGLSSGSGAVNLISQFSTSAGGTITVEYTFVEDGGPTPIPLPAGAPLLLGALAGLYLLRHRRG